MNIFLFIIRRGVLVIIGVGWAWVAVTDVGRPAFSGQPASQATPGANKLSPPSGDYQAQGRGR